jgi:uncharacterized membrane protein
MKTLWRLAVSPVTFVTLCLLWCLDLGLGSLLAHRRADLFGSMDAYPFALWLREVGRGILPWSGWVYLLAALTWLMTASLALCTVNWLWRRRRRWRALGEFLVHLGFLLVFAGYVVGAVAGTRVHGVEVFEGQEVEVPGLGLSLRLEKVSSLRDGAGGTLDTVSSLVVRDARGALLAGTTRLNHPFIRGATVIYPRGAGEVPTPYGRLVAGRYDVHHDPGVWLVLVGGVLLFLGTLWALAGYLGVLPGAERGGPPGA